jgi:putative flippase GtrA
MDLISKHLVNKYLNVQFIKFCLVGGINFAFSMLLFLFLLKVLYIGYFIAFTITWLLGILLTYTINFIWVFKPEEKFEFKKRMPKYFLVYLFSYGVNIILLKYLVNTFEYDPFWGQFFIIPIIIVINFFGFKLWALK